MKKTNHNSLNPKMHWTELNKQCTSLYELFVHQAKTTANTVAIVCEDQKLSLEQLVAKSHQMSHYFLAEGLSKGDLVTINLEDSPEIIALILAIFECGAVYVKKDSESLFQNIEDNTAESDFRFLITSKTGQNIKNKSSKILFIEDILASLNGYSTQSIAIKPKPKSIASVMYIPTATEKLKRVKITHENLIDFLKNKPIEFEIKQKKLIELKTNLCHQITELFLPLLKGETIVINGNSNFYNENLNRKTLKTIENIQLNLEELAIQIQILNQKIEHLYHKKIGAKKQQDSLNKIKANHFDTIELKNGTQHKTNGTNGFHKIQQPLFLFNQNGHATAATTSKKKYIIMANQPPVNGSRLGRDKNGNPAWFIADPNRQGNYIVIKSL
ncbi:AMP-binding protein [Flavobacterium agrisoli]|uniref:AMP-binding protein n=1 Tax=Flavobacterium agrisoli TaxID=2793066 RepID=A0A934PIN9_9FLAO|nr:AMP-binding protein [Flavobacterium agrisoli]MBK0368816.1 AMP-binding protein [Flavobacterium agrisoli]